MKRRVKVHKSEMKAKIVYFGGILGFLLYYIVVGKYIYDLISFFANPFLRGLVLSESRIPVQSSLFPWPHIGQLGKGPYEINISRQLDSSEIIIRDFAQKLPMIPVFLVVLPLIIGIYYLRFKTK